MSFLDLPLFSERRAYYNLVANGGRLRGRRVVRTATKSVEAGSGPGRTDSHLSGRQGSGSGTYTYFAFDLKSSDSPVLRLETLESCLRIPVPPDSLSGPLYPPTHCPVPVTPRHRYDRYVPDSGSHRGPATGDVSGTPVPEEGGTRPVTPESSPDKVGVKLRVLQGPTLVSLSSAPMPILGNCTFTTKPPSPRRVGRGSPPDPVPQSHPTGSDKRDGLPATGPR